MSDRAPGIPHFMKTQSLELLAPGELPVVARGDQPLAISDPESILRYAIDKGADVSVIERMLVVRDKLKAEASKAAYDAAMAAFQSECPVVKKEKAVVVNGKTMYHYAPLDAVVSQTQALRDKHGFSHSMTTEVKPGWVKAICRVTHRLGHSELSEFEVPATSKSSLMNDPQMYAGALTFCKRYAFCNSFGILTADEDLDARTDRVKPAGPSTLEGDAAVKDLTRELWGLLKPVRGALPNWELSNQWLWREEILDGAVPETAPHLPAKRLREVIAKVKEKV